MAHIRVIDEQDATGTLRDIYQEVRGARGSVAEILKVHSLLPETLRGHLALYLAVQFGPKGPKGLGRAEREMLAVAVSAANDCRYCVAHHSDALEKYWKDRRRVDLLAAGERGSIGLTPAEEELCAFAVKLTREPGSVGAKNIEALRKAGYDDEAILQAILTTAYFNFVNRVALATGVDPTADSAKTYRY